MSDRSQRVDYRRIGVIATPLVLFVLVWMLWPVQRVTVSQPTGVGESSSVTVNSQMPAEQTFRATGKRIDGIGVVLWPQEGPGGPIQMKLEKVLDKAGQDAPGRRKTVAVAAVDSGTLHFWQPHVFRLGEVHTVPGDTYMIEISSPSPVVLASSPGDSYADGAAYQSGAPLAGDLTFRVFEDSAPWELVAQINGGQPINGVPAWLDAIALVALLLVVGWLMDEVSRLRTDDPRAGDATSARLGGDLGSPRG
jgi:hypothetical protein